MSLRDQFIAFDDLLTRYRVPPLTAWWRDGIGRWLEGYERGHVLELWACVGRGSAKSTALYKLACFFTLFGDFNVPVGERHFAIVLSRLREEATKGITIIAEWLHLLGIAHDVVGDVIELEDRPRGIRVVAASVAGASGWRAFFVGRDERSKWPAGGVSELDAEEIDTSAAAMTATHARAPVVTFGSAWGAFGAFYETITAGSDEGRTVLGPTPTWIAAPHISEESTHRKERNERKWSREYACEFSGNLSAVFDVETIDRCMSARGDGEQIENISLPLLITDPSGLAKDRWTYGIGRWVRQVENKPFWLTEKVFDPARGIEIERRVFRDGQPVRNVDWGDHEPTFVLSDVAHFDGTMRVSPSRVVFELAQFAHSHGVTHAVSDQYGAFLLEGEFARHGIRYAPVKYTNPSKTEAMEWLFDKAKTNRLRIEQHAEMRKELLEFREKILPSGAITYQGLRHDDFVSLLMTAAMADLDGFFMGSPTQAPARRGVSVVLKRPGPDIGSDSGLHDRVRHQHSFT
jgi:hypothetical protein